MFNIKTLKKYEKKNKLRSGTHPYHDLTIWNYLETIHYKDEWDEITSACRGLVVDCNGKVIARSFPKFFNIEEEKHTHMDEYRVFEKLDGSLGILFFYDNEWIFASRGSFISNQSVEGMKILNEKFPQYKDLDKTKSYIFEVIYPDNRIVVNYGIIRTVIYLTSFDTNGVEYLDIDQMKELGFDVVEEISNSKSLTEYKELNIPNREGFVIRYASGERVKVKFENYISLHRIATNPTVKSIYTMMRDNKTLDEMLSGIPDEFNDWFKDIYNRLQKMYDDIYTEANSFYEINKYLDDKEYANLTKGHKYEKLLFSIYGVRKEDVIRKIIFGYVDWKSINQKPYGFGNKQKPKNVSNMIILIGRSGSGKSTWVNRSMRIKSNVVVVNRDTIRRSIFSLEDERDVTDYYKNSNFKSLERIVTSTSNSIITRALKDSMTVIIDNTNLEEEYIKEYLKLALPDTNIVYKVFGEEFTDEELLERISKRTFNKLSLNILKKQSSSFRKLLPNLPRIFSNREIKEKIVQDITLPKTIIFDIDGTLAINNSGRSSYDMQRVLEDDPNNSIILIAKELYNSGYNIIICSGRNEDGRLKTVEWLNLHDIQYHKIFFRSNNDMRKDFIVKEEMWKEIVKTNYIVTMYDDRNQVVNHARSLGFTVCQVAEGDF